MEKKALNIGQQIEMLKGTDVPRIDGHPMTIGDLIIRIIPVVNSGGEHMRTMDLGFKILHAISANELTFEISIEDRKLLRRVVIELNNHPVWGADWAKSNLERVFDEE